MPALTGLTIWCHHWQLLQAVAGFNSCYKLLTALTAVTSCYLQAAVTSCRQLWQQLSALTRLTSCRQHWQLLQAVASIDSCYKLSPALTAVRGCCQLLQAIVGFDSCYKLLQAVASFGSYYYLLPALAAIICWWKLWQLSQLSLALIPVKNCCQLWQLLQAVGSYTSTSLQH